MKLLRMLVALGLALLFQAGLGRIWPESHRYVDALLVPVVWYGINGTQRSGMVVGCVAGLLQDAWFEVGVFGLNGFKKTLLGWALGGAAARLDLNHPAGLFGAGVLLSVGDNVLELMLRRLLDQEPMGPGLVGWVSQAVVTGVLVVVSAGVADRVRGAQEVRRVG